MKRILVTGGAGYIGSHVCKLLAQAGFLPVVFDNLAHGHADAVRWGPLVEGDLTNAEAVHGALSTYRPAAVIHFAGLIAVGESVADPALYYRNNVTGSLVLLEAMRDCGVGRIVFSSTAAIYGTPAISPIPEETPAAPINPYGRGKLLVEQALADYGRAYGLKWAALRYFNAAGADPEGELGERHEPETHLIPLVLEVAAGKRPALDLFGTDYPTPDGTCVRDYIHVVDLGRAHLLALDWLAEGGESQAMNIGTGIGTSVAGIVAAARTVTGRPIALREAPRRSGDPAELVADPSRAKSLLGWRPHFTDIHDMIRHAWRFRMSIAASAYVESGSPDGPKTPLQSPPQSKKIF